jgi:hypothetical protein
MANGLKIKPKLRESQRKHFFDYWSLQLY